MTNLDLVRDGVGMKLKGAVGRRYFGKCGFCEIGEEEVKRMECGGDMRERGQERGQSERRAICKMY